MFLAVRTRQAAVILSTLVILSPAICGINSAKNLYAAPVELDYMEYNSDANAQAAYVSNSSVTATGGTITEVGGYRIHTFTSNGTFTINVSTNVEVLVVAGGGGGGAAGSAQRAGGGGGGGGLIYNLSRAVTAQAYTVVVGGGGGGGVGTGSNGSQGENSSIFGIIVAGGGFGGGADSSPSGGNGGSGGGAGGSLTDANGGTGIAGPPRQGYNGGNNADANRTASGGGGGAGSAGGNALTSNVGGTAGAGIVVAMTGAAVTYAAGAAGRMASAGGSPGSNATANTGNGAQGGRGEGDAGGNGGSGIVIVRYPSPLLAYSEASIKTQGSYAIKSSAPVTTSLNKTLTRTVSPTIDLSDRTQIKFDIRSTRTGSNIKIGIRDSGGTTTYITPNITAANEYQTVEWDISSVANSDKDAIDRIIIQIVNADAANTFYIDNLFAGSIAPAAPTLNRALARSSDSIEWGWQDNSSGGAQEDGFKVYSSTGGLLTNRTADTTFWIETGLKRNKEYSRYVRVYNDAGEADSSTVTWRTKPGAFQSKVSQGNPTRTGPNAFGFVGDASWEWDVPVKAGAALTITAYIRYNSDYGAASKPKLTLSGRGITPTSISATVAAEDAWELLTLNPGTPSQNATLKLKAEGFSNTPGAKFYVDDINISQ